MEESKDYCKNASQDVNHPKHYNSLGAECEKCGAYIEAIQVTEMFNFNLGNVLKYVWRSGLKNNTIQDLQKASFYLNREIERLQKQKVSKPGSAE